MKKPSPFQLITGLGWLAMLIGLGLMLHTFSTHADMKQRLLAKQDFLTQLATLGQEWQRAQSIKTTYESLSPDTIAPLQSLIDESFTNHTVTPSPLTSTTPLPGWVEWQTSLNIDNVSLMELAPFMQRLAASHPSWMVTRFDVSAVGHTHGHVRAVLGLASLRRDSWPSPHAPQPIAGTP